MNVTTEAGERGGKKGPTLGYRSLLLGTLGRARLPAFHHLQPHTHACTRGLGPLCGICLIARLVSNAHEPVTKSPRDPATGTVGTGS